MFLAFQMQSPPSNINSSAAETSIIKLTIRGTRGVGLIKKVADKTIRPKKTQKRPIVQNGLKCLIAFFT